MKMFSAPEMDSLLRIFDNKLSNPSGYDAKVKERLNKLYELLDRIKPIGDDDLKILYFSVSRGDIESYGDYEELKEYGDVSSYEEFENNFMLDYPDDVYWYRMVTSRYKNYRTISINYRSIICADMDMDSSFEIVNLQELLDFIIYKVSLCIEMLENDTYNDYLEKNLSYKNRFGVIKRSDYWKLYPEYKENLLSEISSDEIDYFNEFASEEVDDRIKDMTSSKYFFCVRLAYENNNYEIGDLSDKELYLKYADGRDDGLCDIDTDSAMEFDKWYHDKSRYGGHPWEIMVGHSFSRINLIVYHDDKGYYLGLNGSIILRKIEIAKIFIALNKHNIPVEIYNVNIIKDAFKGEDYIGIVPDTMLLPIRCEGYFNDYKPLEFINNIDSKILDYVIWQDIEKIYLK